MLYKPLYCCQCGEKIEKTKRRVWSSPRFCEFCRIEYGISDWLWRGAFAVLIVTSVIGIGNLWRKPEKELVISANRLSDNSPAQPRALTAQTKPAANDNSFNAQNSPAAVQNNDQSRFNHPPPAAQNARAKFKPTQTTAETPPETAYLCGAQTKKGTPCSRRVKTAARCWQHAGQAAMLPPDKLIAGQ